MAVSSSASTYITKGEKKIRGFLLWMSRLSIDLFLVETEWMNPGSHCQGKCHFHQAKSILTE